MAKLEKKAEAIRLRKAGFSCIEIAKRLQISSSTASVWCREVQLSENEIQKLVLRTRDARSRGRLIGARMNREARELRVEEAEKWAKDLVGTELSSRDMLLLGIGLYWGEGTKGRKLSFANSNPEMLVFVKMWFELMLGVVSTDFLVRVYINESHRDRYTTVKRFWIKTLGLSPSQFYKPTFLKTRLQKVYENRETYYGVIALRIRKSANLQNRILGLVKAIRNAEVAQVVRASHS